ncbi:MAG TPA: hypothetical protein VHE54_07715 [Puia sp.]|nr:hypothetical protein [Puia sp.]
MPRAAILPAGHAGTGAFWLADSTGHFITSNYYMTSLPAWADSFNKRDPIKAVIRNKWSPRHLFGINSIEIEDTYLRLDKDLAGFFDFLDRRLGNDG